MFFVYAIDLGKLLSRRGRETKVTMLTIRHISEKIPGGALLLGQFSVEGQYSPFAGVDEISQDLIERLQILWAWKEWNHGGTPSTLEYAYPDPIGMRYWEGTHRAIDVVADAVSPLAAYLAVLEYTSTEKTDRRLKDAMMWRADRVERGLPGEYTPPANLLA